MSNAYAAELLRQVELAFNHETDDMKMSTWLELNTSLKGRPFSFTKYPFQRALADDWLMRSSVDIKPSQVGVSEIYQRTALAILARNPHRKIIYAYPSDEMRRKNVQARVKPLLETTKAFSPQMGDSWVNSIEVIQIGTSFLYVTGSKASDTVSTDADAIFLDEFDLHDQAQAALFSSRLQNSDWRAAHYFSTPTFTNFGVDLKFQESDQHFYMIQCDSCRHYQFPIFDPRFIHMPGLPSDWNSLTELTQSTVDSYNIDLRNSYVVCEKCRTKLDLGREDNRSWVSKYPSRQTIRGRKVNCFSVATRPILDIVTELFTYKAADYLRGFENSVLGEPQDSSEARISEALIKAALGSPSEPEIDRQMPTFIGVDMGHMTHLVVGQGVDKRGIKVVLIEQVPLANIRQRIQEICSVYNVISGMVDRHPESQVAADIWAATNGVVVPGEYRGTAEMNLKMVAGESDKVEYVQIDRTTHLDQVPYAIRNNRVQFNGYGLLSTEIITQLRNMIRKEEPEKPADWIKLNPNDHLFHALGFMYSAMKLRPYTEIKTGPILTMLNFGAADMLSFGTSILNPRPGDKKWQQQNRLY